MNSDTIILVAVLVAAHFLEKVMNESALAALAAKCKTDTAAKLAEKDAKIADLTTQLDAAKANAADQPSIDAAATSLTELDALVTA